MQGYENYRKTDGCSKCCAVILVNLIILIAMIVGIITLCNRT